MGAIHTLSNRGLLRLYDNSELCALKKRRCRRISFLPHSPLPVINSFMKKFYKIHVLPFFLTLGSTVRFQIEDTRVESSLTSQLSMANEWLSRCPLKSLKKKKSKKKEIEEIHVPSPSANFSKKKTKRKKRTKGQLFPPLSPLSLCFYFLVHLLLPLIGRSFLNFLGYETDLWDCK